MEAQRERQRQTVRPRDREPSRGEMDGSRPVQTSSDQFRLVWENSWSSDESDSDSESEEKESQGAESDKEEESLLHDLSDLESEQTDCSSSEDREMEMPFDVGEDKSDSTSEEGELVDMEEIIENIIDNAVGLVEGFRAVKDSLLLESLTDILQYEEDDLCLEVKRELKYVNETLDQDIDTESDDIIEEINPSKIVYEDYNEDVHTQAEQRTEDVTEEVEDSPDEEEEVLDDSTLLGQLVQTDWYREYERTRDTRPDTGRSPVYVEEQESGSEYIKGRNRYKPHNSE